MRKKEIFISYSATIIIGLLMAISVCSTKKIFNHSIPEVYKILSDAFLLPATMFCGLGGLLFASNSGFFNMMVYGTQTFFSYLFNRKGFLERYADFYEYNAEKTKNKIGFSSILIPGIVFLILAVSFAFMNLNV